MRVRDEDRARSARRLRRARAGAARVAARVDDDGLGRAALGAHDVAVRPDRAELVAVDGGRHRASSLTARSRPPVTLAPPRCRAGTCPRSRPGRHAAILSSSTRTDEARAVLIAPRPGPGARRPPGEGARLVVRRRRARSQIEAGGETVDGRRRHARDVRRRTSGTRIRSDGGARILLLLAPWPGGATTAAASAAGASSVFVRRASGCAGATPATCGTSSRP